MARAKLLGGDKAIVRNIVGDIHVATPVPEMLAHVRSKLKAGARPALVRAVEKYASKIHADNLREYRQVMGGVR